MADDPVALERIEAELTELAAHINSGTARFLALVAEFDSRKGWAELGLLLLRRLALLSLWHLPGDGAPAGAGRPSWREPRSTPARPGG